MKFKWAVIAMILPLSSLLGLQPAYGQSPQKTLVQTFVQATDFANVLEVRHNPAYLCGTATCIVSVEVRFTKAIPAKSPILALVESGNLARAAFVSSPAVGSWKELVFEIRPRTSKFTFSLSDATFRPSVITHLFTVSEQTKPVAQSENPIDSRVASAEVMSIGYSESFVFLKVSYPRVLNAAKVCEPIPVILRGIRLAQHIPATELNQNVSVSWAFSMKGQVLSSGSELLDVGDEALAEKGITIDLSSCSHNLATGALTKFELSIAASVEQVRIVGKQSSELLTGVEIQIRGTLTPTKINCLRGKNVKVVQGLDPVCPTGYQKTRLKVVNGKLVPTTITCVKGALSRRVTGVLPNCPAGYVKR